MPRPSREWRPYLLHRNRQAELAKNVQLSRIGSRPRAFRRSIDEVRTLPLSPPKDGAKSEFVVFVKKIQV